MNKILYFLIASCCIFHLKAQNLAANFDYSIFNGETPYVETYISVNAATVVYSKNKDGNYQGKINITIVPSFNPYFYATEKRYYKKSISPIIEKIKDSVAAKIVTLDGTIIGNESILNDLI